MAVALDPQPLSAPSANTPAPAVRNLQTIAELDAKAEAERRPLERVVDRVTAFVGTIAFGVLHVLWLTTWIVYNNRAAHPFDPYPFSMLTVLLAGESILLMSFVLISQRHLERQVHRRIALDLQINLLAEAEMTAVLERVNAIAEHLGMTVVEDHETAQLSAPTDVGALAEELVARETAIVNK